MKQKEQRDQRLELNMSRLLIAGVFISGTLLALGGAVYLWRHGMQHPDYGKFGGKPAGFTPIRFIFAHHAEGSGRAVIMLGILVLIGTPIARIVFAVIGFAVEKDRLYTFISLLVLAIIFCSLAGGLAG